MEQGSIRLTAMEGIDGGQRPAGNGQGLSEVE